MGAFNEKTIASTIANTKFVPDNHKYVFAKLKASGLSLAKQIFDESKSDLKVLSTDKWEITLIIPERELSTELELHIEEKATLSPVYCDSHPDWPTCTGYLLRILEYLSPENIGVYVFGAYRSDHILVHSEDLEKTMQSLERLQQDMRAAVQD